MKVFLIKCCALSVGVVLTVLAAYLLVPYSKYALMASLVDKEAHLKAATTPKLIFVGGSSSAFGIDSQRVDAALGHRYDVVNTALHGGLRLRFMLSFVKPHLAPGDIVIVAPEYSLLDDTQSDASALNEGLGEFPQAWQYVAPFRSRIIPSTILLTIQKRVRKYLGIIPDIEDSLYTRRGFNRYGDLLNHLRVEPRRDIEPAQLWYREPAPTSIRLLNDFHAEGQRKNAQVFMTFAPFPQRYKMGDVTAEQWVESLQEVLSIPIISNPDTYLFPLDYFYDTVYHLNGKGRQERTTRLIKDLQAVLDANDSD